MQRPDLEAKLFAQIERMTEAQMRVVLLHIVHWGRVDALDDLQVAVQYMVLAKAAENPAKYS